MLGKKKFAPKLMYNLTLDDLVPEDNIYRALDGFLDLRFLYKECEKLYGKTGKPSIDPIVFFKLQIIEYFEDIISDRELIRKANDTLSMRYFIGYDIDEKLPWHSTISRTRALLGEQVFEKIFVKVLELCYQSGLIEGKHQTIDSTLVKANASLEKVVRKVPELTVEQFVKQTYQENTEPSEKKKEITKEQNPTAAALNENENKKAEDKTKQLEYVKGNQKVEKKKINRNELYESKRDPDSKISRKPGKPVEMYYTTQYCADTKNRIIVDVLVHHSDIRDVNALIDVVDRADERLTKLGLVGIEAVSADKGYSSGKNLRELEERGIKAFIPAVKMVNSCGEIDRKEFTYIEEENKFVCPNGKDLKFYSYDTKRESNRYKANKKDCAGCPLKEKCCPKGKSRIVSRTIYYKEYERLKDRLKTQEGKRASALRKIVSEGLFAEAKGNHGLRKFMTLGLDKAQKNSYIIATVQNLKRLMKHFRCKGGNKGRGVQQLLTNNFLDFRYFLFTINKITNFEILPSF